jgi:hypothetical protein
MQTMVAIGCSLGCEPHKLTGKDVNTFPTDTPKNSATADVMISFRQRLREPTKSDMPRHWIAIPSPGRDTP